MHISRLAANNQTEIPEAVRKALGLEEGDAIGFSVEGGRAVLRKVPGGGGDDDLRAIESTLSEWWSPEDDDAFRDL